MNELEIRELFIRGALVDSRLPDNTKPARLMTLQLPIVHTFEERRGWTPADYIGSEPITDAEGNPLPVEIRERIKKRAGDQLQIDDRGRHDIERDMFYEGEKITPVQVSDWERCMELMALVSRARNRRCLWAYAKAQAKVLQIPRQVRVKVNEQEKHDGKVAPIFLVETVMKRVPFGTWCREVEGIHRNWAKTLADHAIAEITLKIASRGAQPNGNVENCTLQDSAKIRHIVANLNEERPREPTFTPDGWCVRDKRSAMLRFDERLMYVDLSEVRKRDRRKREAKKRKMAEVA